MVFTRTGGDDGPNSSELHADDDAPTGPDMSVVDGAIDNPDLSFGVAARNTSVSRELAATL